MKRPALAYWFSVVFHPAIYPLLGMLAVLKLLPYNFSFETLYLSLGLVFLGTYFIPVLVSLVLYKLDLVSSLMMNEAKDRRLPYLFGAISFYFTARLVDQVGLPVEAFRFLASSALLVLLHFLLLSRLKLSAHMGASAGFLGLLVGLSAKYQMNLLPLIALLILLIGFTASARLALKAHQPRELFWGGLSGFVLIFTAVYWS